jgi:transposase-like protein
MVKPGPGHDHAWMRRQYTAEQRSELIDLVAAGQATIPEAAARLGVPLSTAYYWVRRAAALPHPPRKATRRLAAAKPSGVSPPRFVQLIRDPNTASVVVVRIGRTAIQIRPGFDVELLRAVIELLREIAG